MSIQVEMPKWFIAMDQSGSWWIFSSEPVKNRSVWNGKMVDEIKVTGFTGDWKDSLHHWNGKEWVKA